MDPISLAMALAQFAPSLIKIFTGSDKAEAVAEKVVDIAKTVTGAPTGESALAEIQANPDKIIEFRAAVLAQQGDLEKAYLADVADARDRDIELRKLAGGANKRGDLMVLLDVVGLLAGLLGMVALGWFKAQHPESISEGVFGALLAQLSTITSYFGLCLRDAHQFEFGSSRGSREKDSRPIVSFAAK